MEQRFRRGFTAAEKTELWDRWQRGESLKAIGPVRLSPFDPLPNPQPAAKSNGNRGGVN
jgi:hypothetical protein